MSTRKIQRKQTARQENPNDANAVENHQDISQLNRNWKRKNIWYAKLKVKICSFSFKLDSGNVVTVTPDTII